MSAAVEVFGLEFGEARQDLPIQAQSGMEKGDFAEVAEEINPGWSESNSIGDNDYHGECAICLDKIVLQETALVKGCEHAYCVTCILRWASCKKEPTCPQCNTRFDFLNIHRALDGSIYDYMFEESVCLLLRASWFKTLVEVEKEELRKLEEYYDYYDEDEYYFSGSPSPHIGNRPWGNGYVGPERRVAKPIIRQIALDTDVGPSHRQPKQETPDKELGRRAKRALKREAAGKAAAEKHEQPLARLGSKSGFSFV